MTSNVMIKAARIKCLICDVDGVLTDGRLFYSADNESMKAFHVLDGLGLKLVQRHGIAAAVITSRSSSIVSHRIEEIGISYLFQGAEDKRQPYNELLAELQLSAEQVAYIGDDLPDLPLIIRSGLGIAVPNAVSAVQRSADWVTERSGGHGAVREVCDLLLQAQGYQQNVIECYQP